MFERVKAVLAKSVITSMKKDYDADWFLRFLKLANDEDTGANQTYITDAMKQNAWVNLAVTATARNFSRAPFLLKKGDVVQESGPVWELFNNPNPYMSRYQLWEATISWRKVRGEAVWIYEGSAGKPMRGGIPTSILVVDPSRMRHILSPDERTITAWEYTTDKQKIPFLPNEVVHFRVWNKWDAWRGVSPLIASGEELAQDLQANVSNTKMLANGSVPRGVLTSKQRLTEVQAKELQERWEKAHSGSSRAHRVAVLGAETQYQQIGLSPADFQYFEMKKWTRQTVLAIYGIPPAVVGVKDDMTPLSGADTKEQLRTFWTMTLIPEEKAIEDKLRIDFFQRFNLTSLTGGFDVEDIPELQEDDAKIGEQDRADVAAGLILINEVRERRGKDPVPWGDVWWAPISVKPIGEDWDEEPEPAPVPPGLVPPTGEEPPPEEQPGEEPGDELPIEEPDKPLTEEGLRTAWGDVAGRASVGRALNQATPSEPEASTALKRRTAWPSTWRDKYWWMASKRWGPLEGMLRKALVKWLFRQRSRLLERYFRDGAAESVKASDGGEAFWARETADLKTVVEPILKAAMDGEGHDLQQLFDGMGLSTGVNFNIWDTEASKYLEDRVNRGHLSEVPGTIREKIRKRIADGIRDGRTEDEIANDIRQAYDDSRSRMNTIARTELGGALNDSRIAGYKYEGIEWHSWLSARDEFVRQPPDSDFNHAIDGETVKVGDKFSNGLKYPNDPDGEAGNVINCRCVTLPELKGD